MMKYDKIYVPRDPKLHGVSMDDNYHVSHEGFMGPTGPEIEVIPQKNVIVLTIEEAEAIFTAGFNRGVEAKTNGIGSKKEMVCPDFKTYLENKLK